MRNWFCALGWGMALLAYVALYVAAYVVPPAHWELLIVSWLRG